MALADELGSCSFGRFSNSIDVEKCRTYRFTVIYPRYLLLVSGCPCGGELVPMFTTRTTPKTPRNKGKSNQAPSTTYEELFSDEDATDLAKTSIGTTNVVETASPSGVGCCTPPVELNLQSLTIED